ncbi:hypothetical protein VNO80_34496 [Phaseolus coccineus]|uniref:Uncharacterized protein n=1 Tax=Phaseolus coccineus TaxID=3886 RepID=A0AAN9KWV9_PHACN
MPELKVSVNKSPKSRCMALGLVPTHGPRCKSQCLVPTRGPSLSMFSLKYTMFRKKRLKSRVPHARVESFRQLKSQVAVHGPWPCPNSRSAVHGPWPKALSH